MAKTPEEAIFQAGRVAIPTHHHDHDGRPCLGGLPLAVGGGTGSELRQPLGIAIVGGLIFSQMLTLFTTPVIYLYLDRMRLYFKRGRQETRPIWIESAPVTVPVS